MHIHIHILIQIYLWHIYGPYKYDVERRPKRKRKPDIFTNIVFTHFLRLFWSQAAHKGRNWLLVRSNQGLHLLITDHEVGRTRVLCQGFSVMRDPQKAQELDEQG